MYSRDDKFVVFCSVALHYRIQRTFSHDCIFNFASLNSKDIQKKLVVLRIPLVTKAASSCLFPRCIFTQCPNPDVSHNVHVKNK